LDINNAVAPFQSFEPFADSPEKTATVEAWRRTTEGDVQLPIGVVFQALNYVFKSSEMLAQFRNRSVQHLERDRAARAPNSCPAQSRFAIKAEDFVSSNRCNVGASAGLDPAKRGVHEERGHLPAACLRSDRQNPHFV